MLDILKKARYLRTILITKTNYGRLQKMNSNTSVEGESRDHMMDEELQKGFYSEEGRKKRKKGVRLFFAITLCVLVLASIVNWGIVTGWGNVRIDRLKIVGNDGAEFSALVYVPENATDATPAPGILCFHGNAGNARNHESWAVEFARRGFVVLSVDQFGAGDSQGYFDGSTTGAITTRAKVFEAEQWYRYMLNMPIVDAENIISSGHSMGNAAATSLGALYQAKAVLSASPAALLNEEDQDVYAQAWKNYTGNFVSLTGLVETTVEDAEKAGLLLLQKRNPSATEFKLDTLYGSFEEGNAFISILEPDRIHEAAFVSDQTIGNLLKYGQMAIGDAVPHYIDPENQIWMYKDYTGLFGIFAFGFFVCALALLLIEEIPAFSTVKRPIPRNIGLRGIGFAISAVLAIVFPYIVLKTDAFGLIGGRFYTNLLGLGFNMGYSNMAFGVVVALNALGVLGFLLYFFTDGKKHKLNIADLGLTPENYDADKSTREKILSIGGFVLRTAALSAVVVAIAWNYIKLQNEIFGTDFYAWFFGVKNIPIAKIPVYSKYLVIWILCFVVASFGMNVERRLPSTGKEWMDIILAMVVNIFFATFVITAVIIVKWELQSAGNPADVGPLWKMGVDIQRLWGMPVGMSVGVGGSTLLYKKTGNTWLSAILMGTVACLMCVLFGGTRFHFLTFFC